MEKLDFSKIRTEILIDQVLKQVEDENYCGISCYNCPYSVASCSNEIANEGFKEELKRRENMNDMPELKAGMIVSMDGTRLRMLMPSNYNGMLFPICNEGTYTTEEARNIGFDFKGTISHIYRIPRDNNYYRFFRSDRKPLASDFELVWSKQSPNEKKILELESTVKEALKQIEELKGEKA